MTQLAMTVPILPGKRADLEELAKTVTGPKKKEYDTSEKKLKIDKETWFIESSQQGDSWIFYAEGKNIEKSLGDWIVSKEPFDMWLKEKIKNITGIDYNNPPPGALPKQILKYGL